jgi:hypothetical protein
MSSDHLSTRQEVGQEFQSCFNGTSRDVYVYFRTIHEDSVESRRKINLLLDRDKETASTWKDLLYLRAIPEFHGNPTVMENEIIINFGHHNETSPRRTAKFNRLYTVLGHAFEFLVSELCDTDRSAYFPSIGTKPFPSNLLFSFFQRNKHGTRIPNAAMFSLEQKRQILQMVVQNAVSRFKSTNAKHRKVLDIDVKAAVDAMTATIEQQIKASSHEHTLPPIENSKANVTDTSPEEDGHAAMSIIIFFQS